MIVPLSTVATPSSVSDRRPVANLPHLAKVFDSLITRLIISYLHSEDLFRFISQVLEQFMKLRYYALLKIFDVVYVKG